jgi:protein arginine kinase activator
VRPARIAGTVFYRNSTMICQQCDLEATVHLTESVNGKTREVHLCSACARESGVLVSQPPPELGLEAVVQTLIINHVGELVGELAKLRCTLCGMKFMEFRTDGRLGCPHDYELFESGLLPIVLRSHGSTRHVGKRPKRRDAEANKRLLFRAQLRQAIEEEDYEQAAMLRDELRRKDADR